MQTRTHASALAVVALALSSGCRTTGDTDPVESRAAADVQPPNVVLVFTDDQGYGDLSCYGHPTIHTPHIDAMAARGVRASQFYVASPVCSPSRTALLTGCYPKRVGMHGHVIFPPYDYGLHTDEDTMADVLRGAGYATGCFGKWHLGHRPGLMPLDQGFDRYFGVPYSNDMAQFHRAENAKYEFRLPLIDGNEVIEWEPDQALLTRRCTEAAVAFIDEHASRGPFFAYVPHSMPHIPIYASEDFEGGSPRGLYGDVIEEIDWSVGELISALERNDVLDNTLVIFTTDNGPWLSFKRDGGTAAALRGGKGTTWEGGQRVPFVAQWPGRIPPATMCRELMASMDLLPSIAGIAGAALGDREIDGFDVMDVLCSVPGAESPREEFVYFTSQGKLSAIRRGPYKLLIDSGELYHVEHDISEKWNIAKNAAHADRIAEMRAAALAFDAELDAEARPVRRVDELLFQPSKNVR